MIKANDLHVGMRVVCTRSAPHTTVNAHPSPLLVVFCEYPLAIFEIAQGPQRGERFPSLITESEYYEPSPEYCAALDRIHESAQQRAKMQMADHPILSQLKAAGIIPQEPNVDFPDTIDDKEN